MRVIILFFFISLQFFLRSQSCINLDVHDTSCGQSNGWANVSLNCCGPLEQVNWSTGASGATINNLASGSYSVTITTGPGCVEEFNFYIEPSDGLLGGFSIHHNTCGLNNGQITIFTPPAYPDMTYTWSNGATGNAIYALSSGIYTVIAHTSCGDGTSQTFSFEVLDWSPAITGEIIPVSTRCNLNNGAATVIASGGGGDHTYLWSNGQTSASITDLSPGTYMVTINSYDQCTPLVLTTFISPSSALIASTEITHTKCGLDNGIMEAYPSGNNYIWSDGSTASYIENLSPGAYSVTVTDSNGCTDSSNGIINQSIALNNSVALSTTSIVSLQDNAVYQWIDCNNNNAPISGAINQFFSPTANGNYAVELWNGLAAPYDCFEVSDCVEWIISDTEDQNHNLKVMIPSMVTNACNIEIKNMRDPITFTLTSLDGSIISSNEYNQPSICLKMDALPSGIYFITYNYLQTIETVKIIKI